MKKLPTLSALGINVIEIMPIQAHNGLFNGKQNWGYGPFSLFHLHPAHGSRVESKDFIQKAHSLGMAVILVIGPNYLDTSLLGKVCSSYFYDDVRGETPWGGGKRLDLTKDYVREWLTRSFLMWIIEYGVDGFRVDSIGTLVHINATKEAMKNHERSASCSRMLPEAWMWMSEMIDRVRSLLPTALIIAEQLRVDSRLISLGFDADWVPGFAEVVRESVVHEKKGNIHKLVQACTSFSRDVPHYSRCIYIGNHDMQPNVRQGSVAAYITKEMKLNKKKMSVEDDLLLIKRSILTFALLLTGSLGLPLITLGEEFMFTEYEDHPKPAPPLPETFPSQVSREFKHFILLSCLNRLRCFLPGLRSSFLRVPHYSEGNQVMVMHRLCDSEAEIDRKIKQICGASMSGCEIVLVFNLSGKD